MALAQRQTGTAVNPIPAGYHTATPYLIIKGAADAIEFYKKAFGATELLRMPQPDGRVGHAEIKIGNSPIMLADEFPEMGYLGPKSRGGSSVSIHLYVGDVDAVVRDAVAAGASAVAGAGGLVALAAAVAVDNVDVSILDNNTVICVKDTSSTERCYRDRQSH